MGYGLICKGSKSRYEKRLHRTGWERGVGEAGAWSSRRSEISFVSFPPKRANIGRTH